MQYDIGVQGDRIVWLGRNRASAARRVLQADGLIVAPGFIDIHTHSDLSLLHTPAAEHKLLQGITTEVIGNCGLGVTPLPPGRRREIQEYMAPLLGAKRSDEWTWASMAEYLDCLQAARPAVNAVALVAHGIVRLATMGFDGQAADPCQIARMQSLIATGLEEGAVGLSTGLQYPPGCYATLEELIDLARVVARYGGLYSTHMRSQSTGLLQSVRDTIWVGREARVPVQISHFLAMGARNWYHYDGALDLIQQAQADGLDVMYDMYPYTAGCTMLRVVMPPWVMEGGNAAAIEKLRDPHIRARIQQDLVRDHSDWDNLVGMVGWENLLVVQLTQPSNQHLVGKTLLELANLAGRPPLEFTLDLLIAENMEGTIVVFISSEDNVRKAICGRYGVFGSDSLHTPEGVGMVHPRTYGAYPRYFKQYVRREQVLTVGEFVRKATMAPAGRIGLQDRGLIRVGMCADVIAFDPERFQDSAEYLNSRHLSSGMVHVIVNGQVAMENGHLTDIRAGRVLRSCRPLQTRN
jgi:N-acyl-D-aspartate/D-glutamate deacylase